MINFTENTDVVINQFLRSLTQQSLSPVTVKNYKSDITFFQNWLHSTTPDSSSLPIPQLITPKTLNNFHQYISGNLTLKTANRRLSAIRKFCQFLSHQNYTATNSASGLTNIIQTQLLHQFAQDLKLEGAAPATITNYVSDTRKFLQVSPPPSGTHSAATAKRHLSSWKKFRSFYNRHFQPTFPPPAPISPARHPLLLLYIVPALIFIITFLLLLLFGN